MAQNYLKTTAVDVTAATRLVVSEASDICRGIANNTAGEVKVDLGGGDGYIPVPAGGFYEFYYDCSSEVGVTADATGSITVLT